MTGWDVAIEAAAVIGALPLAWLAVLRATGRPRDVAWWWLAVAFGVSAVTDVASLAVSAWIVGAVYPVTQCALVAAVFLSRRKALRVLALLAIVAVLSVVWGGVDGPDLLLRSFAFGSVVMVVLDLWALGTLRTALLVYFGGSLLAWYAYAFTRNEWAWAAYQCCRLAGLLLFCLAAGHPVPRLRVA